MLDVVDIRWSRSLHLRSQAAAATAGAVVVAERHSRLVGLEPHTGEPLWDQPVEDCWGTVAITGDRCLYLSQAGVLHCITLTTGQPRWSAPGLPLRHHLTVLDAAVYVGGWRGYHPITRLSLTDGHPLPFTLPDQGPIAQPTVTDNKLLIGGTELLTVTASGAVHSRRPLPEPMSAFGTSNDHRIPFLSGRRTVLTYTPQTGVQPLWQHDRDVSPHPPLLEADTLWLTDSAGTAVVNLAAQTITRLPAKVRAAALLSHQALFALQDSSLITVDHTGETVARTRTPVPIDRLIPGAGGLVHAVGKGHLLTLAV